MKTSSEKVWIRKKETTPSSDITIKCEMKLNISFNHILANNQIRDDTMLNCPQKEMCSGFHPAAPNKSYIKLQALRGVSWQTRSAISITCIITTWWEILINIQSVHMHWLTIAKHCTTLRAGISHGSVEKRDAYTRREDQVVVYLKV